MVRTPVQRLSGRLDNHPGKSGKTNGGPEVCLALASRHTIPAQRGGAPDIRIAPWGRKRSKKLTHVFEKVINFGGGNLSCKVAFGVVSIG